MRKRSCFLLGITGMLLLFLYPQMVSAEELPESRSVNIQVDRLEGGPESRSKFSTNDSELFHLEDTQQLKTYKEQQLALNKQQASNLFTKPIKDTTHDTLEKVKLFTSQTNTSTTRRATIEVDFQSLALASLTENNWFWLVVVFVGSAALLASYQMYKRDKNARY
ncbi:hypothetical protein JTF06_07770 [Desemzia sp. RIT804]|uniref:hypothetical protein n=1 Tax=Desemzia sp. RIT 804 TaxID=2810209 RepID=UPI001950986D|nr:hypothetical protein [Desemzia sp. RIT 804]MBM6614788.1 hypothetical protein [Desemzia sp. RIT 804]